MARPQKNNLDYFSHDKDMRNDLKIKALRRKFSHKGYSIYVMMLEHLSDCEYLQYEWNDLSIELLTPDFDVDANELKEIINYCTFLKLFQVEEGIIFSDKFYQRNQDVLNTRKGFSLINSPLSVLKRNKLPDNGVNQELTIVNSELIHKEKESKLKESKLKESTEKKNKEKQSKGENKEDKLVNIMKQIIEDGYITEEEVREWRINDTRDKLNIMFKDYSNWEADFTRLRFDDFIYNISLNSKVAIDYKLHALLKAHQLL